MALNHEGGSEEEYLFDETLLKSVNFEESQKRLGIAITPSDPGEPYVLRPLSSGDYKKAYIDLLAQLTVVGNITEDMYRRHFSEMKATPNTYYIAVIENTKSKKIVGNASLIIEKKFIHELALRGRIEEVIVDSECRGKHFGQLLVETMTILSENLGCYKTSLDCKETLVSYYNKFGYKNEDSVMLVKRKLPSS